MSDEIEKTDNFHFLIEMKDAMEASLNNLQNVIKEQDYLIATIANLKDEHFDKFIEESKEQIEDLKKQHATLFVRFQQFTEVIEKCTEEQIKEVIMLFTDSIGMFESK